MWLFKSIKKGVNFFKEGFIIAFFRLFLRCLGWFDELNLLCYYKWELDCIVVLILGMDISFRRVGFGLGMYDRSLFLLFKRRLKCFLIVFVSRELVIVNGVFIDVYDIEVDFYMNVCIVMKNNKRKYYKYGVNLYFIRSFGSVFDYCFSYVLCDEKDLLC